MSPMFPAAEVSKHLHQVGRSGVTELPRHDVANERETRTRQLLTIAAATNDKDELRRLHDEVVLLNIEIAESIVMRYRNRGVAVEDLVQVACLGLVKAARGFDPAKSDNFLGYAVPTILGEVKRFFRDNAWAVRPPRRIQEMQAQISATGAELMHRLGRVPTAGEIADALGIESTEVAEALAADGCFSPSSLDRPTGDGDGAPLADVLKSHENGFDHAEAVIALAPICRALPERDRRIIYLRFFHEWTQARIAQEFGVTQMQVSRLLTRILKQLREQLGSIDDPTVDDKSSQIAS